MVQNLNGIRERVMSPSLVNFLADNYIEGNLH